MDSRTSLLDETTIVKPRAIQRLHELVEAQVDRTPGALALSYPGVSLTYAELERRANRLAHRLRRMGVSCDTRVGVCAERSPEMMVGLLGVLKAGGAYVPLDPDHPRQRLALVLDEVRPPVVLVQGRCAEALPAGTPWLALEEVPGEREDRPGPVALPSSLAYVIYTSGSTGRPKGVMVSHAAIANHLQSTQELYPASPSDVFLQITPYSFDASIWELFLSLHAGARLVMALPGEHQDPSYLTRTVASEGVTVLQVVPSMLGALLDDPGLAACGSLRRVACGGEALPGSLAAKVFERLDVELLNLYGPTECAIDATSRRCRRGESHAVVPIGLPLPNVRVHVLDEQLQPVPPGDPGGLYVGGACLARGYLDRPDLTAERFVPDPWSAVPGERLYRTGDLSRRPAGGEVEYLGRLDDQVKIRGFRIETGEIEAALESHPAVERALVTTYGEGEDKRLVAYVVAPAGREGADGRELRELLGATLPEYMVPASFVPLAAFPLNANGKIDRRALPAPEPQAPAAGFEPPRNPVEEVVVAVWAAVLGDASGGAAIGIRDSFFEHGGHSLKAVQVLSRLRDALGVDVPLRDFLERPTVEGLAARASAVLSGAGDNPADGGPPLVPVSRLEPLPLSFAQQSLWFLAQLAPDSPFYTVPLALDIRGPLDADVLARSLSEVVRRHEALRTTFAGRAGTVVQVIGPAGPVPLPAFDLSGFAAPEREEEAARLTLAEALVPFDLAAGPLLRARLVCLGAEHHTLVLLVHHIISDGWSIDVLLAELAALYGAFAAGRPSPLPELPVQYADFAVWQRGLVTGEALARMRAEWKVRLDGAQPLQDLPGDRPRPAVQSYRGAAHAFHLPAALSRELKARAAEHGSTVFMALLAAFDVLLMRLSGRTDLVIGSPVAKRGRSELEGLIGLFVNMLPLRARIDPEAGFSAVLDTVRETALAAYSHQDLPFEVLVEELAQERDLSRNPLFQIALVFEDGLPDELALAPDVTLRYGEVDGGTSQFDLTLHLFNREGGLAGRMVYSTDLYDDATIARAAGQLERLIAGLIAEPGRPVAAVPLLVDEERLQLLVDWNRTATDYPREESVPALFEQVAASHPERVALSCGPESLTYRELDRRANQLARTLTRLGVCPDQLVALVLERSFDMVVGMLGVLKAGAAFLPLDAGYPAERLARMLDDARPPVLLTSDKLAAQLPETSARLVCLDRDREWIASHGDRPTGIRPDPLNLAYVMYTSGSTGQPKGVAAVHRGIVRLVRQTDFADFDAARVFLQFSPVSFDASTLEIWGPLLNGGRLALMPPGPASLEDIARVIDEQGVDSAWLTAGLFHLMVQERLEGLAPLRQLLAGGDVLSPAHVERVIAELPQCRLINGYGPTENTTFTCCCTLRPDVLRRSASVPLGRPIANTRVYLLDGRFEPVPAGVAGELYIGGDGLVRGYHGRPDLTAERFVPHPHPETPGERLYRTGDQARYRADGVIEFLGRIDQQVKLRGFRIELAEIEIHLHEAPGVKEAVVAAREDSPGDRRLVAYVVLDETAAGDPSEALRDFLKRRLPDYMVPAAFVALPALPLGPNGKVDRRALPAPEPAAPVSAAVAQPRTPHEEVVAAIWAAVLGRDDIGLHDNFFDTGGNSLTAVQVISRLREVLGVDLPVRVLFEQPTVKTLAARVGEALASRHGAALPPLAPARREGTPALSPAQRGLWVLAQIAPDSPFYNVPSAFAVEGPLDSALLARSLAEVVRRHEALRTTFDLVDGAPVQLIRDAADPGGTALPRVDLSGLDEAGREREATRIALEEALTPFSLAQGPLLRARLVRLGAERHILVLNLHHIVSDGWSIDVLLAEITALYRAFAAGKPSPLPELPLQYADFAVWQRGLLEGGFLDAQIDHWRAHLAGAQPLQDLPGDRPRPAAQSYRGTDHLFHLPGAARSELKTLAGQHGATLFMALLAAFDVLLMRLSGRTDLVVGSPIANRNQSATEGLIGYFVNMLPLRAQINPEAGFRAVLENVREAALGAYSHQDVPFEILVEELSPERDLSRNPFFQIVLSLQAVESERALTPEVALRSREIDWRTSHFDLTLHAEDHAEGLAGRLVYSTDLYDEATIARAAGHFGRLLAGLLAEPDRAVASVPLLADEERRQLLVDWNRTDTDYPREESVSSVFEQIAASQPERVALSSGAETLTYRELDRRANQVARALTRLGVGSNQLVALVLERSFDMVVGMIGILKAGACFLPLDAGYPAERLARMLRDAGPPVVLTSDKLAARLPETDARLLCVDRDREWIAAQGDGPVEPRPDPLDLAYVMYTSGSTGQPKGVGVVHRGIVRLVRGIDYGDLGPDRVFLQFSPISFDASTFEIWAPLLNGGRLALMPPGPASLEDIVRVVRDQGVDTLFLTTGLFHLMVQERLGSLGSLRQILTGGDVISPSHVERVLAELPGCHMVAAYGPTEGSSFTTCCHTLVPGMARRNGTVPLGRPIGNTQVYLLDRRLEPVPPGVAGELYVGGDGLARGYHGRPDLTADRFVPHPHAEAPGERLYRTGDLARYRSDGLIEFLGRADHQVKLRGFRIELGEIESSLQEAPGVKETLVIAREDNPGDRRLVAYVVMKEAGGDPSDALRAYLKQRLPDYMVPSAFVALPAMPLDPNGKMDRRALPAPPPESAADRPDWTPPRTPAEEAIAGIWSEVLRRERIDVHDDFFELGGHSLMATRVVSRLRDTFGLELPLSLLFEARSIAELAEAVEQRELEQADLGALALLLDELEHTADDEAERLTDSYPNRRT